VNSPDYLKEQARRCRAIAAELADCPDAVTRALITMAEEFEHRAAKLNPLKSTTTRL
jgi:hypothetical protein